jgi:hypothetical protein
MSASAATKDARPGEYPLAVYGPRSEPSLDARGSFQCLVGYFVVVEDFFVSLVEVGRVLVHVMAFRRCRALTA